MSDDLTRLQVIRDLGMVLIPAITALGGVFLAQMLEERRKKWEAYIEASRETWKEHRTKIVEVKNLAAILYERRTSNQYDHFRKSFLRDLEALHDLAGYWHLYDELLGTVPRYLNNLRSLYEKTKLDEDESESVNDVYWEIDIACTKIIDKLFPLLDPWKQARLSHRQDRKEKRHFIRWAKRNLIYDKETGLIMTREEKKVKSSGNEGEDRDRPKEVDK